MVEGHLIAFYLDKDKKYERAFAELRQVTVLYPETTFSNQAYYYIGVGHFEQKHLKPSKVKIKL